MLLSRVIFSSWLTSLWSLNMFFGKCGEIWFTSCNINISPRLKHWFSDYTRHDFCKFYSYFNISSDVRSCLFSAETAEDDQFTRSARYRVSWTQICHSTLINGTYKPKRFYCLNIVIKSSEFWNETVFHIKSNKAQSVMWFIGREALKCSVH